MIPVAGHDQQQQGALEVVPAGRYLAHVTEACEVQAKGGMRSFQLRLDLTLKHQGRRARVRVYLPHTKADGRTPISYGRKRIMDLAGACHVAPGPHGVDEQMLVGKLVEATLKHVPGQGGFREKNELDSAVPARKEGGHYIDPQAVAAAPAEAAGLPAGYAAAPPQAPAEMEGNPLTDPAFGPEPDPDEAMPF